MGTAIGVGAAWWLAAGVACGQPGVWHAHDGTPAGRRGVVGLRGDVPLAAGELPAGFEWVHGCWECDSSRLLTGVRVAMPAVDLGAINPDRPVLAFMGDNRLDLVFVGDGYTSSQMATYRAHVNTVVSGLFAYEPFTTYRNYFRITAVEVVSAESGVDNDPAQGVLRNTAMDMAFWCGGTERLLCVNVTKAYNFARGGAADVDQVVALANSTKYGGAGYTSSNLGTASGGNGAARDIVIHELGHSMGDLADEYDYGGSATYTGPELSPANVSIYTASQLAAQQRKWHRWLGVNNPAFDGLVDAYQGGNYSVAGVYRPTFNSMMRSLARPFNLPSAEALIRELYREVSTIDDARPVAGSTVGLASVITVTPMQPIGHSLSISWQVNGSAIAGQTGFSLDLGALRVPAGAVITARVVDPTTMVRDEALRSSLMTDTATWTVTGCAVDLDGSGGADVFDLLAYFDAFGAGRAVADVAAPAGTLNVFDVLAFLAAFGLGC